MTEFVKVQKRKKVNGIEDPTKANDTNLNILKESLTPKLPILKESELYEEIKKSLQGVTFTKIRCLALGSPSQEQAALYQFALLQLIIEDFEIKNTEVSLYDPVFNELDNLFITSFDYKVKEEYNLNGTDTEYILYFLPHAPLSLTNIVISKESPKLLLANNIVTHTDRLTKQELFNNYPLISKFVNITENDNAEETKETASQENNEFQTVIPKKKNNRRQKGRFVEKKIDHSTVESYFDKIQLRSFKSYEEGPWMNAFTDIALHRVL